MVNARPHPTFLLRISTEICESSGKYPREKKPQDQKIPRPNLGVRDYSSSEPHEGKPPTPAPMAAQNLASGARAAAPRAGHETKGRSKSLLSFILSEIYFSCQVIYSKKVNRTGNFVVHDLASFGRCVWSG
jgi:hypothetical protein